MQKKNKKLWIISLSFCSIAFGVYLILYALSDNIVFFYTPSEIDKIDTTKEVRIGGFVSMGAAVYSKDEVKFVITDKLVNITVQYKGVLPALFRENQGVVVRGFLDKNTMTFEAKELLIKHDEKYKPPK